MKLYHITDDLSQPETMLFTPRIPNVNEEWEDVITPRVCLAPSIECCILAVPDGSKFHNVGDRMRVYTYEVTKDNMHMFVPPTWLFAKGLVCDALDTYEVWCIAPIVMHSKCYEIANIQMEYKLSFNNISPKMVLSVFNRLNMDLPMPRDEALAMRSEDLFDALCVWLHERELYDAYDELYDGLCENPIAQTYEITKLELKEIIP